MELELTCGAGDVLEHDLRLVGRQIVEHQEQGPATVVHQELEHADEQIGIQPALIGREPEGSLGIDRRCGVYSALQTTRSRRLQLWRVVHMKSLNRRAAWPLAALSAAASASSVAGVVTVTEPPFLLAVHRIVGCVEIEDDLRRRRRVRLQ